MPILPIMQYLCLTRVKANRNDAPTAVLPDHITNSLHKLPIACSIKGF